MAKRLYFSRTEIQVAEYDGAVFFHREQITQAVGYKNSMTIPEDAKPITVGRDQYLSYLDLTKSFSSATGERRKQCIALLHAIQEQYSVHELRPIWELSQKERMCGRHPHLVAHFCIDCMDEVFEQAADEPPQEGE